MSCHVKLFIVYPHTHLVSTFNENNRLEEEAWALKCANDPNTPRYEKDPDGFTIWSANDQIDFDNINRTPGEPRQAALVYIGRCCTYGLGKTIETEKSKCVAPPFLLDTPSGIDQMVKAVKSTGINQAIQCIEKNEFSEGILSPSLPRGSMRKHNQIRMRPDIDEFLASDKFHRPIEPIATWHSCTQIAQWIEQQRPLEEPELLKSLEQPMAVAVVEGWRQYLKNVGDAGARGLIIYGHAFGY
jgi:hypothetical protein